MKIKYILLILSILAIGCKEEFLLELKDYDPIMVVDGIITDQPGPYTIKVSKASPVNKTVEFPFEDCIVSILDNTGYSEVLLELEPGIYTTIEGGIQGLVGNEYQISIITPDGKEYETEFQEMKEAVGIESVYAEKESRNLIEYPYGLPGYQFYTNTKTAPSQDNFFLWNMIETYEYDIDYELYAIQTRFGDYLYSNPRYDTLKTCWYTQKVNYVFAGRTSNLSVPQITHQPLHFVSTESKKLTKRYSVLINQYNIGKQAYIYWKGIEEQSSNENFLNTSQPYNIIGNIKSIVDKDETVLGFFTVASVSQKRIFINKLNATFYYTPCAVLTDRKAISDYKKNHSAPYFWVEVEGGVTGIINRYCIDCRTEGGELNAPDFWIDY